MGKDDKAKSGKEIAKELESQGFKKTRQKGSHAVYEGKNGKGRVVVPLHGSGSLPKGTQRSVERQIDDAKSKQKPSRESTGKAKGLTGKENDSPARKSDKDQKKRKWL